MANYHLNGFYDMKLMVLSSINLTRDGHLLLIAAENDALFVFKVMNNKGGEP